VLFPPLPFSTLNAPQLYAAVVAACAPEPEPFAYRTTAQYQHNHCVSAITRNITSALSITSTAAALAPSASLAPLWSLQHLNCVASLAQQRFGHHHHH
jgi:hypothetical protein